MKSKLHRKTYRIGLMACLALMLIPALLAFGAPSGGEVLTGITALGIASASGTLNMTDLAKMNATEVTRGIIEDSAGAVPEWSVFPAEQLGAGELKYDTLIRTGFPVADFHDMGGGLTNSKSTTRMETFETFPFGGRVDAVVHVADNYKRGGAAGYFAFEAIGIAKAAMFRLAQQIYYGRAVNGKGFPGLKNFTAYGTSVTDPLTGKTYNLFRNANGTTANTASSVYLVRMATSAEAQDGADVKFGTGSVFDLPDPVKRWKVDPNDATKEVQVYSSDLQGFAGLCIPNVHTVRRIGNLTDDNGCGLTDALLAAAMQDWPQGIKPTHIFMSAHQQYKLQISRTVVLQGDGQNRPNQPNVAPLPTEYNGIPFVITDAISDTDAIESSPLTDE